jgi:hypothetical protein
MTVCTSGAGPGIHEIHDDLVRRGGRLVDKEFS